MREGTKNNLISRKTLFTIIFSCFVFFANAQNPDDLYDKFSRGYENLDAELVGSLYAEKAVLLNLYNNNKPESYKGRKVITHFFSDLFKSIDEDNKTLKIVFKVTDRKRIDNSILDNGFYHLTISEVDMVSHEGFGKFSIVLQKESGEWKFFTDANSSATSAEFEKGISIEANQ